MKKLKLKIQLLLISVVGGEKALAKFIEDHADEGIDIVNKIRMFLGSPLVVTLFSIIPSKYANFASAVRDRIETVMDKVIALILVAKDIEGKNTFNERLRALINYLDSLSPAMKEAAYLKIASLYAQTNSNNLVDKHLTTSAIQDRFIERFTTEAKDGTAAK